MTLKGIRNIRRVAMTLGVCFFAAVNGFAGQEQLLGSVTETVNETKGTQDQLAATMSSLNALHNAPAGTDLRPLYQDYVANVDKTKAAAETTHKRAEQMQGSSANYFGSWKSDNDAISNADIRKNSTKRLASVEKSYGNAVVSLQAAGAKFKPFLSDLTDIQTALSNDLTPKGLKSSDKIFKHANKTHADVQKEIGKAMGELQKTQLDLNPVAAAK